MKQETIIGTILKSRRREPYIRISAKTNMNRDKMIDAMEAKTLEIYNANKDYQANGKRGMMVAQVRSKKYPDRWESTILAFGAMYSGGFSFDTTIHEKIAYVRRTGKNSGVPKEEVVGTESFWEGAVISDDGNCICAFSGFAGTDDILIAEAGIAEYHSQL